jgi:hypothetical protein
MHKQIKNILVPLLLFIFLFPMVEKEVHTSIHSADVHCTAGNKHFHDLEHHCSICDFTLTDSNKPTDVNYQLVVSCKQFLFQSFTESLDIPGTFQYLPSRAPPTV